MAAPSLLGSANLVRVIGRWDLTFQVVNITMGASIFVVPGLVAGDMGGWAPIAVVIAAAGVLSIVLAFAEAAGRYREPGGMYRYAGDAFGEYVGSQIGLLYWITRVTAGAAVANVFATYLAEFWPAASQPLWRIAAVSAIVGAAGAINISGTRQTSSVVNALAMSRLVPLGLVATVGLFAVSPAILTGTPQPDASSWAQGILFWVFAFGGFEAALIPAAESTNPERDGPRALLSGMALVALVYVLIQVVVSGTLSGEPAARPVGEAARIALGNWGALFVALAALLATTGHFLGSVLASSRITFAMGERGRLPSALARVNSTFRTPHVSIALFTVLVWIMAVTGSFASNAAITAGSRLIVYAVTCVAVLRLRRFGPSTFEAPAWVNVVGVAFCVWLLAYQTLQQAVAVAVALAGVSLVLLAQRFWQRRDRRLETGL